MMQEMTKLGGDGWEVEEKQALTFSASFLYTLNKVDETRVILSHCHSPFKSS